MSRHKSFPKLIHVGFEGEEVSENEYLVIFGRGVDEMEPGERCAIYQLVDEGEIRGPRSFVSTTRKSKRRASRV